jgi:FMN phosphatase YigB (HAD superfamily)
VSWTRIRVIHKHSWTRYFAAAVADPAALTILASLRTRGFRTAIVSNTLWGTPARAWRSELAPHGLLASVHAAVFAVFCTDVGYRKPYPAPFEQALSLLDISAEAIFVGDDPRWDVAGARRAGVRPILLAPTPIEGLADTVPIAANLHKCGNTPQAQQLLTHRRINHNRRTYDRARTWILNRLPRTSRFIPGPDI